MLEPLGRRATTFRAKRPRLLRYQDYALLKGYRQLVNQTYINPQDNRMTPNTFQGVTLGGQVAWVAIPQRVPLADQAEELRRVHQHVPGRPGPPAESDDGVGLFGVRLTPLEGLRIDLSNQYGVNTFNTIYAEADYLHPS